MSEARPGNFAHLPFLPVGIAAPYTTFYPPLYEGSFFQGLTEASFMSNFWDVMTWTIYTVTPVIFTQDGVTFTTYMDEVYGSILFTVGKNTFTADPAWVDHDDLQCNFRRSYDEFDCEPTFGGAFAKLAVDFEGTGDYTGNDTFNIQSSRLSLGDNALLDLDNYITTDPNQFTTVATPVNMHFDQAGDNIIRTMYARDLTADGYPAFAWSGGPIYIRPYAYWPDATGVRMCSQS